MGENPNLMLTITDPSGVNISDSAGHSIVLSLDNGDSIAKGNYFYKVKAKTLDGSKSVEKLGKFIIWE